MFDTDGIPERNFPNKMILKKSAEDKKACEITHFGESFQDFEADFP